MTSEGFIIHIDGCEGRLYSVTPAPPPLLTASYGQAHADVNRLDTRALHVATDVVVLLHHVHEAVEIAVEVLGVLRVETLPKQPAVLVDVLADTHHAQGIDVVGLGLAQLVDRRVQLQGELEALFVGAVGDVAVEEAQLLVH
ncbi:hypothetical protein BN1708_008017, partial [Verticillium longisporum]